MKRNHAEAALFACLWLGVWAPSAAGLAEDKAVEKDAELGRIDRLYLEGRQQHDYRSGLDLLRESLEVCVRTAEQEAEDYAVLWRCARSAYQYGETAEAFQVENWKEICREWGKKGMEFSERAQRAAPGRVEGYFWETACIGIYADATGVLTAVKEGFYEKSKTAMARAYEIDKSYNDFDPVFGSAMFHVSVPFPLKDKKKALSFYREFEASSAWTENPYVRSVHAANLLLTVKDGNYREEAGRLLDRALSDPQSRPYYRDWAKRLRKQLQ